MAATVENTDKGRRETPKTILFKKTREGDWKVVLTMYHQDPLAHNAKINDLGDTALHLAVSLASENIVEELVKIISEKDKNKEALKIENELGNNPLHLAASKGTPRMCICIAEAVPELGKTCNKEGESPLFLAALHGKTDIFLCLHFICISNSKSRKPDKSELPNTSYCRKICCETILHCVIKREYLDLAYQILCLHSELATSVDKKGTSPLHLLADKPSAFKSGCYLGWWNSIIYHWITVDAPKEIDANQLIQKCKGQQSQNFPDNYRACIDILKMLWKGARACIDFPKLLWKGARAIFAIIKPKINRKTKNQESKADEENPTPSSKNRKEDPTGQNVTPKQKALKYFRRCFEILKFVSMPIPVMLEFIVTTDIRKFKEKHILSVEIMKLVIRQYNEKEMNPFLTRKIDENKPPEEEIKIAPKHPRSDQPEKKENKKDEGLALFVEKIYNILEKKENKKDEEKDKGKGDTEPEGVLLMAAKNGITEMVKKILESYPMALHSKDKNQKNIVLLTVEHKQPRVYELLLSLKEKNIIRDSLFCEVDSEGNSVLHLAATLKAEFNWPVPGAASQMQWEIRWYEYIENSMEGSFPPLLNKNGQSPEEVFTKTHEELVKQGGEWLNNTSNACSVVAGLFVTSTFSTATNVADVVEGNKHNEASKIFASSSFVSFYASLVAVVMFLSILTSGRKERDFRRALPWKLLLGLTAFYMSIASTLVSFTAGHFFIFRNQLKFVSSTSYVVIYTLVTLFSMAVFPLFFHLAWATLKKVPQRKYRAIN